MQIGKKENYIFRPDSVYTLSAEETNQIVNEILGVILWGGITPSAQDAGQMAEALQAMLYTKTEVDAIRDALQTIIDGINAKIPAEANANNKLADRQYVDTLFAGTAKYMGDIRFGSDTPETMNAIPTDKLTSGDRCFVSSDHTLYTWNGMAWAAQPVGEAQVGQYYNIVFWFGNWNGDFYKGEVSAQITCYNAGDDLWNLIVFTDKLVPGEATDEAIGPRTLSDNPGSNTVPPVGPALLTAHLQALRDYVKYLGETKQNILTAGPGITIVERSEPGGFDQNTLAVFKFENTSDAAENSVPDGSGFTNRNESAGAATTAYGAKFGAGAYRCASSSTSGWLQNSDGIANADFTVDFWVKWGNSGRAGVCTGVSSDAPTGRGAVFYKNKISLPQAAGTGYINNDAAFDTPYDAEIWHHCAYVQDGSAYRAYIDGVQVASGAYSSLPTYSDLYVWGWGGVLIDEVRVSNAVRYTDNFTPPSEPYEGTANNKTVIMTDEASGKAAHSMGEVFWSQSPLASDNPGGVPLWTGAYYANASALYPDFYAWVKEHTELCTTKADYDARLAQYGEVPFYVVDEVEGSLRLPKLSNYIKNAGAEGITQAEAGVPNITGGFGGTWGTRETGAFARKSSISNFAYNGGAIIYDADLDASRSSPVYGKSDTVTPAHTTLYPWVCAFNSAIPVSIAQAAEFQGALNGKANTDLANVASNIDYVVESYSDNDGNWYRVWKSKRVEQGGVTALIPPGTGITITFFKEFANTSYTIISTPYGAYYNTEMANNPVTQKLTTSFNQASGSAPSASFSWYACGQGAE